MAWLAYVVLIPLVALIWFALTFAAVKMGALAALRQHAADERKAVAAQANVTPIS